MIIIMTTQQISGSNLFPFLVRLFSSASHSSKSINRNICLLIKIYYFAASFRKRISFMFSNKVFPNCLIILNQFLIPLKLKSQVFFKVIHIGDLFFNRHIYSSNELAMLLNYLFSFSFFLILFSSSITAYRRFNNCTLSIDIFFINIFKKFINFILHFVIDQLIINF